MNVSRFLRHFILVLIACLPALMSQAQGFRAEYNPEGKSCRDFVTTSDGGFLLVGNFSPNSVLRANAAGDKIWSAEPLGGANAVAVSAFADGSFAILGENHLGNKNIVAKIDAAGTVLWSTPLPNTNLNNGLQKIIVAEDGNLLLAGNSRDAQLNMNAWLLKLNSSTGAIIWQTSFGSATADEQVSGLLQLPGGSIIVGGIRRTGNTTDFFLNKRDAGGNELWDKNYPKTGRQTGFELYRHSDGGLLLLGFTAQSDPTKITLLKTDIDGVEDWYQAFYPGTPLAAPNVSLAPAANSLVQDDDGNIYLPGRNDGATAALQLIKLDQYGFFIESIPLTDDILRIRRTSDGFLALAGTTDDDHAVLIKMSYTGQIYDNHITGSIYHDQNDNCSHDSGEGALKNFVVEAHSSLGHSYYTLSDQTGAYTLDVPAGEFEILAHPQAGLASFWAACDTPSVTITGPNQTAGAPQIGIKSVAECPLLDVDLSAGFMRRCTTTTYYLNVCNYGNLMATNASADVLLDPLLSYVSSSIPLTSQSGNTLHFNLIDLNPGECQSFSVKVFVSCNASNGMTICSDAHVFPDTTCLPAGSNYDGSEVEVSASCNGTPQFKIKNIGANDMTATLDYVIIEDHLMLMAGKFKLDAGEDTLINISNPSGEAYYLRALQSPGFPGLSYPSAAIDNCNGSGVNSLLLELPQNVASPAVASSCEIVTGSFDPNDKRGFPMGWKNSHNIERGQELDYMIRFQNTGTDTAFHVIIKDSLPAELNAGSLRPGASSHPYTFHFDQEGRAVFVFSNILLPDSTTNEAASHGFVRFQIKQQPELAIGTTIRNKAAITFDFNDPIITNESLHTIGEQMISAVNIPYIPGFELKAFPNPFSERVTFTIQGVDALKNKHFVLFNSVGQVLRTENFSGTEFEMQRRDLPEGLYFYRLESAGVLMGTGKLIVH